ncbi:MULTISPECIES: DUF2637 domain-containing protein [unclassified Streptomyces]|uniref:DUF2637 domain-containing protein n=1 Tax=unclassified Streptomyces TaxID=2593676 RepID=UPI0023650488|nr:MULTISPECIES: DUF2637 domain-containing protein [unclassified Streptomyces]MDF3140086.1 DUF2637 domain-containing protein [Streptomyces sp. T21Q-yed]WDF40151.1 DUF2637 domain-containing protein [Streptomyces sp. T12]
MTTTTPAPQAPASAVPPLTKPEMGLAGVGALAAAGVGALGLIASFDAVSEAAARWGFGEPWMLPVGIDVAIPVFTVANLLLIRMDMALAWVRFVPWLLTLVTCGLNVAAGHGVWAKVAHGTMPLLWVVFSEIGAHIYAVRIGAATGRRMEKIRWSRWLMAPLSTFALWRRMTLWEVTSYSLALTCERERLLARADLHETYGWKWRWKTPRRDRVMLRMGELAPATEQETPAEPPAKIPPEPSVDPKPRPPRRTPAKGKGKGKAQRTFEDALTEARKVTVDWTDGELTADRLRTTLHVSQANARKLRDTLKGERAEGRPLHAVDAPEGQEPEAEAA